MDEAARRRAIDAGERIIGERGFFRVTLAEIAAEAGLPPDELEAEFADPAGLTLAIAQVRAHELRSHLHVAVEGLASRHMMEGAGFEAWFEWIAAHPAFHRVLWQADLIDQEVFRNWYRDLAADYVRGLNQAMHSGEIPVSDPEALAYCLMGMGDFLGMRYIEWDNRPSIPADVLRTFLRVMTKALQAGASGPR